MYIKIYSIYTVYKLKFTKLVLNSSWNTLLFHSTLCFHFYLFWGILLLFNCCGTFHYRNMPWLICDCPMVCKVQLFEISHDYKHCCHAHSCGCLLGYTCEWLTIRQVSGCGTGSKSMATLTVSGIVRLFSKEFVLFPRRQPPQQATSLPFLHILAVTRPLSLKLCY